MIKDKVTALTAASLKAVGIRHGWFMRYGGVSEGLFKSLNGKKGSGDSSSNVDENRRRALRTIGLVQHDDHIAHIVHNFRADILMADAGGEFYGYDASITSSRDIVLSQTTADCGTVIITDSVGSVVAMVHGSWHTLKEGIISKTVAEVKKQTSFQLMAAVGPMICHQCYEFGVEAAELFDQQYLKKVGDKYLVNLKKMIFDQLEGSGVELIDDMNICTKEDERFFSHRRYGANSGRFLTLASLTSK